MNMKRVLITGVNGYVGNHLSRVIREKFSQAELFGLDVAGSNKSLEQKRIFFTDIADENKVAKIMKSVKPDYIFHLAGVINSRNWEELYLGNVDKTGKFLELIAKSKSSARIIIPGSAAEYGGVAKADLPITEKHLPNPLTLYGLSKVFQTNIARYYSSIGLNVAVGRIFNFIGNGIPDYMAIGAFLDQIKKIKSGKSKKIIKVGNIKTKRDYLDIYDICTGLIAIAKKGRRGEIYNICSGRSISMEEILRMMINKSGLNVKIIIDKKRIKKSDINDTYGSNKKIRKETGWKPGIPIESSIRKALLSEHAE